MTIYVPEHSTGQKLPLLILLHGVYGSHWNWWALGGVTATAQEMIAAGAILPFAIAMPSDGLWDDGSGYVPHRDFDAEKWIIEDVPAAIDELLPDVDASRLYLAGQSMGGYGALRIGTKYSDRVCGISAHSAVTSIDDLQRYVTAPRDEYLHSGEENVSITHWAIRNRASLPPIRFDCGLDDDLLASNRSLHAALLNIGVTHTYEEYGGGHTWEYWQAQVRRTLSFVSAIETNYRRGGPKASHALHAAG